MKIDNHDLQITHSVRMNHSILAAQVGMSGSSTLGKNVSVGGQASWRTLYGRRRRGSWRPGGHPSRQSYSLKASRVGHSRASVGRRNLRSRMRGSGASPN